MPTAHMVAWGLCMYISLAYNCTCTSCSTGANWSILRESPGLWGDHVHAAVCLGYGGDHPQLLVTGGLDAGHKVLSDAWLLDVKSGQWREVSY